MTYQCCVLWVKLVPFEGEPRKLDGVQLRVYERLRNADLVDEHPAGQGLLQVDGVQGMPVVVVLHFQYDETNCEMTALILTSSMI